MKTIQILLALLSLAIISCSDQHDPETSSTDTATINETIAFADRYANPVGRAHGLDTWRSRPALAFDFHLISRGTKRLAGSAIMETTGGKRRMELDNGVIGVFDGNEAWVTDTAEFGRARFHLLTWPYFLAAAFKLRDPGTNFADEGELFLDDSTTLYDAAKLSFGPGIGDAPDDWYITYRGKDDSLLHGMAYIVTYSKSQEKAEQDPHAIAYYDFQNIDGAMVPTRWELRDWSREQGLAEGGYSSSMKITNLRFVEPEPGTFTAPEGAIADKLPEK